MSLKKRYLKTKPECQGTFRLPKTVVNSAETAHLVGDFNGWETTANPMRKLKDGTFTAKVNLKAGEEYPFRYLIDGETWENDPEADRYVPSPYPGNENSVVIVSALKNEFPSHKCSR